MTALFPARVVELDHFLRGFRPHKLLYLVKVFVQFADASLEQRDFAGRPFVCASMCRDVCMRMGAWLCVYLCVETALKRHLRIDKSMYALVSVYRMAT